LWLPFARGFDEKIVPALLAPVSPGQTPEI